MRRWLLTVLAGALSGSAGCDSRAPAEPTPPSEAPAPAACVPTTCAIQHQTCGELADGCGATLTCGAACATPPASTSVCEGLLPAPVIPSSQDITTGFVQECDREPALDGQGHLVFATENLPGHHGISSWYLVNPKGNVYQSFNSNPSPRLWPQANGFQMISILVDSMSNGYTSFQAFSESTGRLVEEPIGAEDNPSYEEINSAPDPTGGTVVAWLERVTDSTSGETSVQVKVRRYDDAGRSRFGESIVMTSPVRGSPTSPHDPLAVGTDLRGRTLVLWTEQGTHAGTESTVGRWLDADGTPLTPVFPTRIPTPPLGAWRQTRWTLTPLLEGGLALQALETLTHGFASGVPQESPLPEGLAGRQGRLERGRGGKAYALLVPSVPGECGRRIEVLAPDGTACGTLTFGAETCQNQPLVLGAEGSILQRQDLAHVVTDSEGFAFNGCTLTQWPGIMR